MLDATIAGASANSYLSVAAADDFAANDLGRAKKTWQAATVEDKEAALIRATADIDEAVQTTESKAATGQALLFPRSFDVDTDGSTFIIPARLRRATYLQAVYLIDAAELIDDAARRRARGLVNFSNPDGTGGQVAEASTFGLLHPRVERMLDEFSAGGVIATIVQR